MSSPPILTFAPAISPEAPDWLRQHLTLIYQKLGNHAQAFQIQNDHIKAIKGGGSTTTIIQGLAGGGGSGPIAGTVGGVADHSGVTSVTTVGGEYGSLLVLNDASPVAVTLSTQSPPWFCWFTNLGAGAVTLTPFSGTINGGATLVLSQYETAVVAFDGTNWFAGSSPISPITFTAVTHQFLVSYDASTGLFAAAQPSYSDLSGTPPASTYTIILASGAVAASTNQAIFCDTTTAGFTVTLPLASASSGKTIVIKKISTDGNTLTVSRAGSDLIDGATTFTTSTAFASIQIVSDGVSNWYIV